MSTSIPLITSSFITTFKARTNKTQGFRVSSCNVTPPKDNNDNNQLIPPETQKLILPNMNVDRRNLLVGLGGTVCTTANLSSLSSALSAPSKAPDPVCRDSHVGKPGVALRTLKCCPPGLGKEVEPFVFPKEEEAVRMRWPAHKGKTDEHNQQVEKYKRAIAAMRALPDDHPHSFKQQASIHCAYCNGGYTQADNGFPNIELQIHNSWLFFPFHRWYLYFYERILGKLIGDPTFALPYWNWDDPAGMEIPEMFLGDEKKYNPLYDAYRDPKHQPQQPHQLLDLAFSGKDKDFKTIDHQKNCNLLTVYRDLVTNAVDDTSFFGGAYVAGDMPVENGVGSVESGSHTAVHRWVGNPGFPNSEDMGNFYSAGYDPLFYVHHANVDRMWKLWKDLCLPGHVEPAEDEWLNASYVFYDENEKLVRVYNKDSVDIKKLKFDYAESDINNVAWKNSQPEKRKPEEQVDPAITPGTVTFPLTLTNKNLIVPVKRRVAPENVENYKEVLYIDGISYKGDKFVKFDVFVNDKVSTNDKALSTCDPEYAGGFTQIAHGDMSMPCGARFGLNEPLVNTNYKTKDGKEVVVKLVPRTPKEEIKIANIKIDWVPVSIPFAEAKKLKSPVPLGDILKVSVDRPTVIEILTYKQILSIKANYPDNKAVKFDVFVNDKVTIDTPKEKLPTACSPEYAGRFARLPLNKSENSSDFEATFELDKVFRDTKTETQKEVVVALVPKTAETKALSITDIAIELVKI